MKYNKEQRLLIGREIYTHEITISCSILALFNASLWLPIAANNSITLIIYKHLSKSLELQKAFIS